MGLNTSDETKKAMMNDWGVKR